MNPTKTQAIFRFLQAKTRADLADLYSSSMECQVLVAQDNGKPVEGEYVGRIWRGWTDGVQTWKPFRIPFNASTKPEYTDAPITFDLDAHVEGIGMTGWDWELQVSKWVAFDFDAIVGHSDRHSVKLAPQQLADVESQASKIPWVTVRKSTSGRGLHLYVFLEEIQTENHNEHAAVGRAILGQMSAITGFDFISKVDIVGGNMWVWHRKMVGTDGLTLVKEATELAKVPLNWKDHIKVVSGQRKKMVPQIVEESTQSDSERMFGELCGQNVRQPLDEEHKKLIKWFQEAENVVWWWDNDNHMLVTHTLHLKRAHKELSLRGLFDTSTSGSSAQNCFCFPLRRGAWGVRRFTPGVKEHETWQQDGAGWTRTYLNREPDLASASRSLGGVELPRGGFAFREAEVAIRSLQNLGINLPRDLPPALRSRKTILKEHKDGTRVVVEIDHDAQDNGGEMQGWFPDNGKWKRIFTPQTVSSPEPDIANYDDVCRHLITEAGEDRGWVIRSDNLWVSEPLVHVKAALEAQGVSAQDCKLIVGSAVSRPWTVVNRPFQQEYPGDRAWNRKAAQLRYLPKPEREGLKYPHWRKIFQHCGRSLDAALKDNPWAKANGVLTGADYLKLWTASLIQEPNQPLPYLFFWGDQNTGKSIFHEALSLLMTSGVAMAHIALQNPQGFNAEIMYAVLCVVEEVDLRKSQVAYNRIKDWVTSLKIAIHEKGKTPYMVANTTHWIHDANNPDYCPIFTGDTRITMIHVEPLALEDMVPKKMLLPLLEAEACDMITELLALEIPPSNDRLNVPVITTEDKLQTEQSNRSLLELFIDENCHAVEGEWIKFSEFYDRFQEWLSIEDRMNWSKIITGRQLPRRYIKGRNPKDGQYYIGNISFEKIGATRPRFVLRGELLVSDSQTNP